MAKRIVLSERDSERLQDALRWVEREKNLRHRYRKRRAGAGGGASKKYARVVQTLRRPDPTADPPITAITCYKIKLLSESVPDDWSEMHGTYDDGDKVVYEYLDYECTLGHVSSEAKNPTNTSYWTCLNPDAYVLGYLYDTDLLGTVPWLQVNDVVEVIQQYRYDDDNQIIAGTQKWYIHETIIKVEEADGANLYCSLSWNPTDNRAMAVYK